MIKSKRILVWFRNDLRLHDNEMLVEAIAKCDEILPVYIFDPRNYEPTSYGTMRAGSIRTQFLLESVMDLRRSFRRLGGDLLVLSGRPEELLPQVVEAHDIAEVYHHREVAEEETRVSTAVEALLWKIQVNLRHFIGHTLYNKEDLPFPIKDIPDVFAQFKKKTERDAIVKACYLSPEVINFMPLDDWGVLPQLSDLIDNSSSGQQEALLGGEQEGLSHLKELLSPGSPIYLKASRGTGKPAFSSMLSPWLALGCLSPRMVYWLVKDAEEQFGSHPNFNQIVLGLLWRDYFRFMFKKHGSNFFDRFAQSPEIDLSPEKELELLEQWQTGKTGNELVDAAMLQLNTTGYIPHASRLLLATYLIYVLKIHWEKGAAYFEEKSIDYAPANNWCNWAIVAGGARDRGTKKSAFDLDKQFKLLNVEVSVPA